MSKQVDSQREFHHTLRNDLIKDLLLWAGGFFLMLGLIFMLTLNGLVDYMLEEMAATRLNYQASEFAKHLALGDTSEIDEEADALTQDKVISGMIVIDAAGLIAHISLHDGKPPILNISLDMTLPEIQRFVADEQNLRLFEAAIPGQSATLLLILDKRPVITGIYASAAWTGVLLFLLILISIIVLHFSLRRHLINPIDDVRRLIHDHLDSEEKKELIDHLPDEVAVLAESYEATFAERKLMEQQFIEAQKMEAIGTLVGGIAHDFNNALAGITGNLYLAKQRAKDMPELLEKLNRIDQLALRSAEMVGNLLSFAHKSRLEMRPLSLGELLNETLSMNKALVPENITFKHLRIDENAMVMGDAGQLQQALLNLINNAYHAVAEVSEPEIEVCLERFETDEQFLKLHEGMTAGSYVRLCIHDNGCGIPPENLPHIFEPFFTTKEVGVGTGLGLAMVYGSVKSHGGMVDVRSTVGEGTTFHLYFPLEKEARETAPASVEVLEGHGERVLVADDDEDLLEALADILESLNYTVLRATDGAEALEIYQTQKNIQAVLLDVVMPNMSGPDVARAIRASDKHLPIVFITGYDREDILSRDAELSAGCHTMKKPFTVESLSQVMHNCIEASKKTG